MTDNTLEVNIEMLIRKPVADVYAAFVDPALTTKFWFTKSSGVLTSGARVRWDWEMYGVGTDVVVKALEEDRRILIAWDDGDTVEWIFTPRAPGETFVTIINTGFTGTPDEIVAKAINAKGGFTTVLCGAKAFLEYGITLNLIADHAPDALVEGWPRQ